MPLKLETFEDSKRPLNRLAASLNDSDPDVRPKVSAEAEHADD